MMWSGGEVEVGGRVALLYNGGRVVVYGGGRLRIKEAEEAMWRTWRYAGKEIQGLGWICKGIKEFGKIVQ